MYKLLMPSGAAMALLAALMLGRLHASDVGAHT